MAAIGAAICPECNNNIADTDPLEAMFSFYSSPLDMGERMEGNFNCPECGEPLYFDASVRSVEEG